MRKFLLAAGLLSLGFSSCKKQDVIINTEPPKPPFRISGLSDINVQRNPFNFQQSILAQLAINVIYEYGEQRRVSLSVQNLPEGIKDSFYVRSGYPDFSSYLSLYDQGIKAGNYTARLIAKADGDSASISYPFNISITGDTSCNGYYAGRTFSATNTCSGLPPGPTPGAPYTVTSVGSGNAQNELLLTNYKNDGSGTSLRVIVNCRNYTITVPAQIIGNNITVQGSGQLSNTSGGNPDIFYLNLNERNAQGNTTYCNYAFQIL